MHLTLLLPGETLVAVEVGKIVAEATNGSFCLLPRHADLVAPLVAGLLSYVETAAADGARARLIAVDEGTLVKCGAEVWVSVRDAVLGGDDPAALRRVVSERFRHLDEQEKSARSVLARLEAGVVRRFAELR